MIQLIIKAEVVEQLVVIKDKKGITLANLAAQTEIEEKELSRILSGIDSPKLDTLNKIAAALGMKIVLVDSSYIIE